jgi:hypothetical protein
LVEERRFSDIKSAEVLMAELVALVTRATGAVSSLRRTISFTSAL